MSDHAIGRVDRFIEGATRKAGGEEPKERRCHAIGEILGKTLDGCTADACFVERVFIAPHDLGDGVAPGEKPVPIQGVRNGLYMIGEAPLREKGACNEASQEKSSETRKQPGGKNEGAADGQSCNKRHTESGDSVRPLPRKGQAGLVPPPLAPC
jgi:hypothetical protein